MKVRIISGDHLETCKFFGLASGIISQEEFDQEDVCMTGEEFRKKIGPISKIWDPAK
jgi:magnesium-transporting ATPase (P-type)